MILFASGRTDIPAFYSKWLSNRVKAGFLDVRNPYFPQKVTRYELSTRVVDCIVFCTKNPRPMFDYLDDFAPFSPYVFVTITPYGTDIEPNVPEKEAVMEDFIALSGRLGKHRVCWRYDPILVTEKYSPAFHIKTFRSMCETLAPFTDRCIISFVDVHAKTRRIFPELQEVCEKDQLFIARTFAAISGQFGMTIESCAERLDLSAFGVENGGCVSKRVIERAAGIRLREKSASRLRRGCACLPMQDIAHYNCCPHLCRYCYANHDAASVERNRSLHDDDSPFLIGKALPNDELHVARLESWRDGQLRLF